MRVQVHINPDCTQAVASLVRRERDSVREELGGGSNMKGSSFSELNRVLELRSLKDSTGHLNTNTMYCIKSKVSSVDGKQTVFAAVATPRGLLRGPTALASGNRIQRHGDQSYNTNADKTTPQMWIRPQLLQCFRVLTKLKSPWGDAELDHPVRHKCDCARFYKYMNCKHSLREAILSGLRVPPKHAFGTFGPKAKRGRRCVPRPVSCSDYIRLYTGKFLKKVVRMQIWQWPRQGMRICCSGAGLQLRRREIILR